MKKILMMLICCSMFALMAVAFLIPRAESTTAYAAQSFQNFQEIQELLENTIVEVEKELADMDTDIVSELYKLLAKYEATLLTVSGEDIDKIQFLINSTQSMIEEYEIYEAQKSFGIQPMGSYHYYYSPAVSAIISGFGAKNWELSAELLTHMKNNNTPNSYYTPFYGYVLGFTSTIGEVANSQEVVGTVQFQEPGKPWLTPTYGYTLLCDEDAYYGVHWATYKKTYRNNSEVNIRIRDYYNFISGAGYRLHKPVMRHSKQGFWFLFIRIMNT